MKKNKIICIYKITSPTNKIYIGQTIDFHRRLINYKNTAGRQVALQNSFNKYGFINHIIEIIEKCIVDLLNERERYWQDYYDVLKNGLNCKLTTSRNKSGKLSEETKTKIGNSNRGKKKPKLSILMKGNKRGLGRKMPEEQKNKLSKDRIGKKNPMYGKTPHNLKKINVYDKNGLFLFSCKSSKEAQENTNVDYRNISAICKFKRKSGGGYVFRHD